MDSKELLRQFWNDKATMQAVKSFIEYQLEQEAIERTFNREEVTYLADAQEVLIKSFEAIDDMFTTDKKPLIPSEIR